jgi:hypothetical protein
LWLGKGKDAGFPTAAYWGNGLSKALFFVKFDKIRRFWAFGTLMTQHCLAGRPCGTVRPGMA